MAASTSYPYGLFTRNAPDIVLSADGIQTIRLTVGGETRLQFVSVWPDEEDNITVRTREILEGLTLPQPDLTGTGESFEDPEILLVINGRNETSSIPLPWIKGELDAQRQWVEDYSGILLYDWWTPSGGAVKACRWGSEQLSLFCPSIEDMEEGWQVWAEVVFQDESSVRFPLKSVSAGQKGKIVGIATHYARIRELADAARYTDKDITSWTVWAEGGQSQAVRPVTFFREESGAGWVELIFRNSLGVRDSLYARGKSVNQLDYDHVIFRNRYQEKEWDNRSARKVETYSGYLETPQERNMWMELLESKERYIRFQDGDEPRQIIVDETHCELEEGMLCGVSFTWHYADTSKRSMLFRRFGNGFPYSFPITY